MNQLPKEWQVDKNKVEAYLLHPTNSRGKARFFERLGFSQASWEVLRDALLTHAASGHTSSIIASPYGSRYIVTGVLQAPNRLTTPLVVVTVWQQDTGTNIARLITAYPG